MKRLSLFLLILLSSCSHMSERKISDYQRWGYQLQGYEKNQSLRKIYESHKTLWVIDSQNNTGFFSTEELDLLKSNDNLLISYFSIGEAESYRSYFKNLPKDLLIEENKDWEGNFRVKYWDERWVNILYPFLEKIIAAGYDGVYLDIVDAFDYYEGEEKRLKAIQMKELVSKLHQFANSKRPGFRFIQQNGLSIIKNFDRPSDWFELIDAVGIESMFFSGPKRMNNPKNLDHSILSFLDHYKAAGKPIFSVEYIYQKNLLEEYRVLAHEYQVIPLAAAKELDGQWTVLK